MACKRAVLWAAVLITLLAVVWVSTIKCSSHPILGRAKNGFTATSLVGDDLLQNIINKRIAYVESRRSILTPVNSSILNALKPLVNSLTVTNIPAFLELLPGNRLGFLPLEPLTCPDDAVLFQFEQGRIGWYWLYMTFPDQTASVMFYLNRVELMPRHLREKNKLAMGNTTIYQVGAGVGINGQWYRLDYYANSGIYQIADQSTFKFNTVDNMFTFSQVGETFTLQMTAPMRSIADDSVHKINVNLVIGSSKPMYFNGANGCQPCLFGDGTMYLSYTDLFGSGYATIDTTSTTITNGVGWMDHQWGGSEYSSVIGKLLMNVLNKGAVATALPKYTWINLHVSSNLQYMVFCFPTQNPNIGDNIECYYNRYVPEGNTKFLQKCKIQPVGMINYGGIDYPNRINITVDGETYLLDTSPYGTQITVDINNAPHFDGCGNLYNIKDLSTRIGTGFIENQRYISDDQYHQGLWTAAGLNPASIQSTANWYSSQKDTGTYIFSLSLCIVGLIMFVLFSYKLGVNIVKNNC